MVSPGAEILPALSDLAQKWSGRAAEGRQQGISIGQGQAQTKIKDSNLGSVDGTSPPLFSSLFLLIANAMSPYILPYH